METNKRKPMKPTTFEITDYLEENEMISAYLNTVLAEGDSADLVIAIGQVAKAVGMTKIAEETGMSRPSLYKALAEGSKPQFDTIMKVLKALGGKIQIEPLSA